MVPTLAGQAELDTPVIAPRLQALRRGVLQSSHASDALHAATIAAVVVVLLAASPVAAETFEFPLLNRTYEAFIQELSPVEIGPAHVALSSPQHTLTVLGNQASLVPDGNGDHLATVELELEAAGRLEADVRIGTLESHIGDDLVVPRQRLSLAGRVRIQHTAGGYEITALELPPTVEVKIESLLARRLFALCHQMALVLVSLRCATLEEALTRVVVPLPAPGQVYLLPDSELRSEDRERLDAYLGSTTGD
jgi:hypothetical protein